MAKEWIENNFPSMDLPGFANPSGPTGFLADFKVAATPKQWGRLTITDLPAN